MAEAPQGSPFTRLGAARDARHRPGGVPGVANIIAVASGKGGVGKSTVAVNLALALKEKGLRVGVLDADIYGPSMPRLLGLKGQPQQTVGDQLEPMQAYGLKVMSMGFLVDEETPMIWRGPMVMSALSQMLKDVAWGELDVLVVDMPPGTGDAQLTMAQQVPLAGAVIVSTPQDLALIDARKGLNMFRRVNVPVLGLVENMSTFVCPHCGQRSDIFGHGGAKAEAARLRVPFLGEVPLTLAVRESSDEGRPVVASDPSSPAAEAFRGVAAQAWAELERGKGEARAAPRIVMEG
jgi:ATP-binding protein involved in chromosome partitioning